MGLLVAEEEFAAQYKTKMVASYYKTLEKKLGFNDDRVSL
jgi:hypothetical protein